MNGWWLVLLFGLCGIALGQGLVAVAFLFAADAENHAEPAAEPEEAAA